MDTAREIAAIPLLVRQQAQDAAFLWTQRAQEVEGPLFGEVDLGRRDQRMEAHLEGLAASGRRGWETAREEAFGTGDAGSWFVWAALAFKAEGAVAEVEEAALAAGAPGWRGLSGAAAWTPPARLGERVRRWVVSAEPALRRLGAAALGHHRVDPGSRLGALLDDSDPDVRARGARLAGELGRADAARALAERAGEDPWAAWSGARMGEAAGAAALLDRVRAAPEAPEAGRWLDMAVIAEGARAREVVTDLLGRPATHLLALSRIGTLGDAAVLPWLEERMRPPETAAAAGAALRDLFAVDFGDTDLFSLDPAVLGPGFDGSEPTPVAERVAAWRPPPAEAPPFVSGRARMLGALREGVAAPSRPLPPWRHRRQYPAWV